MSQLEYDAGSRERIDRLLLALAMDENPSEAASALAQEVQAADYILDRLVPLIWSTMERHHSFNGDCRSRDCRIRLAIAEIAATWRHVAGRLAPAFFELARREELETRHKLWTFDLGSLGEPALPLLLDAMEGRPALVLKDKGLAITTLWRARTLPESPNANLAREALRRALVGGSPEMRAVAAMAFGKQAIDLVAARATLLEMATSDPSAYARSAARDALAALADREARELGK